MTPTLEKDDSAWIDSSNTKQNIPYVLKWTCPQCHCEHEHDYTSDWYIESNTNMNNGIEKYTYFCQNEWQDETGQWKGCDGSITISMRIKITAEIVDNEEEYESK